MELENVIKAFVLMEKGMAAIFIVIIIICLMVVLVSKLTAYGEKEDGK